MRFQAFRQDALVKPTRLATGLHQVNTTKTERALSVERFCMEGLQFNRVQHVSNTG